MTDSTTTADAVRIALVTCPDTDSAATLVRTLVEESLVACGNIVPGVRSIYRWRGTIEDAGEVLVVLKTVEGQIDAVAARVAELHPYDVPEFLVLALERGAPGYLAWVVEETRVGS